MEEKKTSIIALLNVLRTYSDEEHILSQNDLNRYLTNEYGISLDRRTIYKNIDMLIDLGYEISCYEDNKKGYYLVSRQFEASEVYLLCNAIHASNYIPAKASNDLIEKLLKSQSKYFKNDFKHTVFVENYAKKENKQFFINIEIIAKAIKENKTISFNYLKYDKNKNLVNRKDEPYVVSPYNLVYANEKTYLVAKDNKHPDFTHYRLDKIKNVKTTNDQYLNIKNKQDPYEYAKSQIYMFHGEPTNIVIRCDYSILDDMIDIFGKDINIVNYNDYFDAYIKSSKQGIIYLALQYLDHMEVLEPDDLRQEIKKELNKGLKKYK